MIHELKSWPETFEDHWSGRKSFDFRKNDRGFTVGDTLRLREWNPTTETYTGRGVDAQVVYIVHGGRFDIPEGFVIMGLERPDGRYDESKNPKS